MLLRSVRILQLALALIALLANSAKAQKCNSVNQGELNECAAKAAQNSSKRLERLLSEISSREDASRSASLHQTQLKWESFRDSQCTWEADAFAGGSVQPMWYSNCVTALTEERIADLKYSLCEVSGMTGACAASRKYDLPKRKPRSRQ